MDTIDERCLRLDHEFAKDRHRWRLEWFAAMLVLGAFICSAVALLRTSNPPGSPPSTWGMNLLCTITGAAVGYVLKTGADTKLSHGPPEPRGDKTA
jgi:hypothetical protein